MKQKQAGHPRRKRTTETKSPLIRLIGGQYEIINRWPVFLLVVLTYILSLPMFAPWSFWPVAYVVFVPWVTAVCITRRCAWLYLLSYLLGAAFFLTHFQWLYSTTPEGYIAGSLFLALNFPLAAWPIRHLYRKWDLSLAITFPIVWTAIELMRSLGPLGFPWFLLGHTQIRLLTMIQIADLTGVYGVTFVVATVNGWLVDLLLRPIMVWDGMRGKPARQVPVGTVLMLLAVGMTVIYGRLQLGNRRSFKGPRIAVLQGDYLMSPEDFSTPGPKVQRPPHDDIDRMLLLLYQTPYDGDKRRAYLDLMAQAAKDSPDAIILPETPWSMYLNRELLERQSLSLIGKLNRKLNNLQNEEFKGLASEYNSQIVVGSLSAEPQPEGSYPAEKRFNSAFVYTPGQKEPGRYDKIHLVLFGEYVPFRNNKLLHPLYKWLNSITPFGADGFEYSLDEGTKFATFPVQERSPGGNIYKFGITICYEDAVPQVFRKFVVDAEGGKRVSFMLNISNDGWFGHGTQQAQHLVTCTFRAVENRVGIARAVNTGISGFIDPDGTWHDLMIEPDKGLHAGGIGHRTADVMVDQRVTFYSLYGDVFALGCALLALVGLADAMVSVVRSRWTSRKTNRQ